MKTLAVLGLAATLTQNPFLPVAPPQPKILKILAPRDFIDRATVEAFEKDGATVALDQYSNAADLAERSAGERYDLVVLRGPALARRLAAGALTRLDRRRLPNAKRIQPLVAAKYAAYDKDAAFGVPFGWTAFGLLYDADKWPEPPAAWAQALGTAKEARRAGDCGVVWPDARDESFWVVWKLIGVDPARAKAADVKPAAALLDRARGGFLAFAAPDEVGAFVKGAACLGAGTAGEAAATAVRGGDSPPTVRFAYPREGAPLALYAYAIPADAASPDAAYRFLDMALAPETARQNATAAGVNGAEETADVEALKRLTPEPVWDAALATAMQAEWKRLTSSK